MYHIITYIAYIDIYIYIYIYIYNLLNLNHSSKNHIHFPKRCTYSFSCVQLFATLQTVTHQAPLSTGILQARILEWVAISYSRDLSGPGIKPMSLMSFALAGRFFITNATWEDHVLHRSHFYLYQFVRDYSKFHKKVQ